MNGSDDAMLWICLIPTIPYFITIIVISIMLIRTKGFQPSFNPGTSVSVIIACRNEENSLPSILTDLFAQIYPLELFQVIIVDDNSTDNTQKVLSLYKERSNLSVLTNSGSGKKSAIRTGIEASESELIITTDADCRMGKNWISSIISYYKETNSGMIIGPVIIEGKGGFFTRFQELEFLSLQGITAGTAAMKNPVMCNGANLAFKRDYYLRHYRNLHEEITSGDDMFLLHSLKRENAGDVRFLDAEDAVVTTGPSLSAGEFLNQRSRWLSKAGFYRDWFTIYLGIITFVTILDIIFLLAAGIFNSSLFIILGIALLIKSLPDIIILYESAKRRGRTVLLKWFLPAQIIYPFYVMGVVAMTLFRKDRW